MDRIQAPPPAPIPVADDVNASAAEVLARAQADYAAQRSATREHQAQGGAGVRQGVLPGDTER